MKTRIAVAVAAALALASCSQMETMMGASGGWETLFDGKGMDNFEPVGDANWRIENGLLVADKGQGYLLTKKSYKDFTIRAEFYAEPDTNSGIFIRCDNRKTLGAVNCYEFNIWDTRPGQDYRTGGIVDTGKVTQKVDAGGKWNTFVVTAKGDHLVSELNGVKVAEARNGKHSEGPFALQRFNGNDKTSPIPIKWRKVQIKPL